MHMHKGDDGWQTALFASLQQGLEHTLLCHNSAHLKLDLPYLNDNLSIFVSTIYLHDKAKYDWDSESIDK